LHRPGWHFRRIRPAPAALAVAVLLAVPSHDAPSAQDASAGACADLRQQVTFTSRTMGTYARVVVVADDSVAAAPHAGRAQATFVRVDSLMSNWTQTSEVARINREAGRTTTTVHPEVAFVIDEALRVWRESDGAEDITVEPIVRAWGFLGGPKRVPTEAETATAFAHVGSDKLRFDRAARTLRFKDAGVKIDLGGIAKGYAVDAAADSLKARGVTDALVDISGNMVALGKPPGAERWRIGVRDPRDRMPHFARVLITQEAISTSGKYEQFVAADGKTYGHIIDPRTGRPAEGLISVTVVARTAMEADAWDTPLFVLGAEAAMRKAKERDEIAAVLVEPGENGVDTVWVEESLKGRFVLEPEARRIFQVRYF
jgi:thiamine biosynthesis lipoprotein